MTAKADIHWRKTRRLTFVLIACWIFVNFGLTWFARAINEVTIRWYNRQMNKLDAQYGVEDD